MAVDAKTPIRCNSITFNSVSYETAFGFTLNDSAPGQEVRVADNQLPSEIYSPTRSITITVFMLEANTTPPTPGTRADLSIVMGDTQATPGTKTLSSVGSGNNALCTGVSDNVPGLGNLPGRQVTFLLRVAPTYA